ncbi:MAG: glycosyltransferase, partial [Cellulomonadaceae bacterium]|nr:glycosyltransferase [Cellulomonadaceae bacterium]
MTPPEDHGPAAIDVMVPYWGDPAYLRTTVESVIAQTRGDWRLTVLDDAYPDTWAGEYLAGLGDERIRYLRNEANEGITASFARCVQLAEADVVTICGCDDVLLPTYVETVLKGFADHPDVQVVQPGVVVVGTDGLPTQSLADAVKQRIIRPRAPGEQVLVGERLAVSLLHGDWLYWPSLAFRREALVVTPFRAGFPIVLDLALIIDMVCAGARLLVVPTVCFAYRRHAASASSVELLDGDRFAGERAYFDLAGGLVAGLGWRRAARAARLH